MSRTEGTKPLPSGVILGRCDHKQFAGHIMVTRMTPKDKIPSDDDWFRADVQVQCAQCRQRLRWNGLAAWPGGDENLTDEYPLCDPTEVLMLAPMRLAKNDPDKGMGIPGGAVRRWELLQQMKERAEEQVDVEADVVVEGEVDAGED